MLNTDEGETLSTEDMTEIFMQVMGEMRVRGKFSLASKTKTGEINDYLEVRRPFGAAQWEGRPVFKNSLNQQSLDVN